MKRVNQSIILFAAILIVSALLIVGCSSTGMQRSEKATSTMETMNGDINMLVVQLDATGASLDELTRPEQSDIKKSFDLYKSNVSKMESMEKQFNKHAEEMKNRGKEYFEEWQKEGDKYKNSQIQRLSEQRREELGEVYGKIAQNSVGVKDAIKAYMSDSKEILSYLSNDLTPKGVEKIVPSTRKVVNDGDNLKYAIKDVQAAIDHARAEMSQSGK